MLLDLCTTIRLLPDGGASTLQTTADMGTRRTQPLKRGPVTSGFVPVGSPNTVRFRKLLPSIDKCCTLFNGVADGECRSTAVAKCAGGFPHHWLASI